jgi:putative nucleotidyltransferase with HDIG domain
MKAGLFDNFLPELHASVGHAQNRWHAYDVWKHTLVTVDNIEGDPLRRLGALLHDVGKPATAESAYGPGQFSFHDHDKEGTGMAQDIVNRLKLSNDDGARVVGMVEHHMFGYGPDTSDKALRRFIKKAGAALIPDLIALRIADIAGKGLGEDWKEKLPNIHDRIAEVMDEIINGKAAVSTNQLAINGRDVMRELGIEPGKKVGVILKVLLDQVMDNPELNERESLLKLLPEVQC